MRRSWSLWMLVGTVGASSACSSGEPVVGAGVGATPVAALRDSSGSIGVPSWATPRGYIGRVDPGESMTVSVHLALRDEAGARALFDAVSNPESPAYRRFLTSEEWNARFAPSDADVAVVRAHLEAHGLSVAHVPSNRAFLEVVGPASAFEAAFAIELGRYASAEGEKRAPRSAPVLPPDVASRVTAAIGLTTPPRASVHASRAAAKRATASTPDYCSNYYGQAHDTSGSPKFGPGYAEELPFAFCSAYVPSQIRHAYGLDSVIAAGIDGRGETVAVVGAWSYPTICSDPQTFAKRHDAAYPLAAAQCKAVMTPGTPTPQPPDEVADDLSEFTSDIEAVHAIAPGANVVYVAGQSDSSPDLLAAFNYVVSENLASLVTLSAAWLESDEPAPSAWRAMAIQAGVKGIGLHVVSGDFGDYVGLGAPSPSLSFPSSLPEVTSAGGTSLALDAHDNRVFEVGWSTGVSFLYPAGCEGPFSLAVSVTPVCPTSADGGVLPDAGVAWWPADPGGFYTASGGGVSALFPQPEYQAGVVPAAIAGRDAPMRAVPDIAMVADFNTPTLQGCSCGGTYIEGQGGGTSYSSPAFTAAVALAQQFKAQRFGAINAALYGFASRRNAFTDIVPSGEKRAVFLAPNGPDAWGVQPALMTFEYVGPGDSLTAAVGWDTETGLGAPAGVGFLLAMP